MSNNRSVDKELRLLSVVFQTKIQPWELPKFRGAMAHKVGLEHEWFHNHKNQGEGKGKEFHYRYPLIQYKLHQGRPMLLCLDTGVEEAHHFFSQPDWSLRIGKEQHDMRIHRLQLHAFQMRMLSKPTPYRIHNYLALNSDNFKAFLACKGEIQRLQLVERILKQHLLRFADGIAWELPDQIELSITKLYERKRISFKGIKKAAFNFDFECNLFIPDFVGLGQGSTLGFGVLKHHWEDRR